MRRIPLTAALIFLALAGCQYDDDLSEEDLGQVELASVGGGPALGETHYDAVAAITIERPNSEGTTETVRCTGVLVEDRSVLTSADCLSRNVEAQLDAQLPGEFLDATAVFVQFGSSVSNTTEYALDSTFNEGPNTTLGVTLHRYYEFDGRGLNDIALLRLAVSPGIAPVAVHNTDLEDEPEIVGKPLELVGYGKDDNSGSVALFAVRSVVDPLIEVLNFSDIVAGDAAKNTCHADRGGPGFLDFDGTPKVVTVTGSVATNEVCDKVVNRQRVDRYAEEFIIPYITRFGTPCVGASCDACDYDGECKEDCPTRDWDCEIGVFAGEPCDSNGQCEQLGHCIAATDDPTFSYCAIPCDTANTVACPASMTCGADNECIYDGISPGSQGAACTLPTECRSGFCEALFCANTCDNTDANSCDTEGGFACLPASDDTSVTVCRLDVATGGGGFCGVSSGSSRGTRNTFLTCFGFLFLLGLVRRRLRHQ